MTYSVSISDAAEAEMEKAYLHLNRVSPEIAGRWYAGLLGATANSGRCHDGIHWRARTAATR
jgi:hypothetical protein